MDSVWYYVRDGKQNGPVSFEELKSAAAAGRLAPGDLVWKEGTADWVAARTVTELFPGPPPPPLNLPGGRPPEPLPHGTPGGPSAWANFVAIAKVMLRRAVLANPAHITPTVDEESRLTAAGILDPTARRYAVWRRAMLWVATVPTGFAAVFGLINVLSMSRSDTEALSGFGVLVMYLEAFFLFALPAAAVLGAQVYDRPAKSARLVLLGGAISLGVPLLVAFIPGSMLLDFQGDERTVSMAQSAMGIGLGILFYITLMPTVLSLLPAASRACERVKAFLPQSLVPGWGLVASVPLFFLLTLATFILLYHVVGNVLLVIGLVLWVGSPLLYLTKFRLLTRPVTDPRDMDALARTQVGVVSLALGGVALLILYLFTAKFMGHPILGFDSDAVMRPWTLRLHRTWIEYFGRPLFLTVLFADLLVQMALSVWREERAFVGSDAAAGFDRTMSGLADATEPKRPEPPVA